MNNITTRRDAAKAIAVGAVASLITPTAIAAHHPDARLLHLVEEYLCKQKSMIQASLQMSAIYDSIPEEICKPAVGVPYFKDNTRTAYTISTIHKLRDHVDMAWEKGPYGPPHKHWLKYKAELDDTRARIVDEMKEKMVRFLKALEESGYNAAYAEHEALYDAWCDLGDEIAKTPATTMEGVTAKLSCAMLNYSQDDQTPDQVLIESLSRDLGIQV